MLGEVNALERAIDRKIAKAAGKRTRAVGTVSRIDVDGTVYVLLDGADGDTIVSASTASVKPGDAVSVRIENGRAVIEGNTSDPSASSAQLVQTARKADSALVEAERAHQAADEAEQDAARAATAADNAEAEASRAATAAVNAEASAGHAATSAGNAEASASQASASAGQAATSASQAATSAGQAATSASNAATSASEAADAAHDARERADDALSAANAARDSAGDAALYATSALGQLGVVQDVIGVLTWASEHGTFERTSDTSVQEGKVYFTYDSQTGDYTPVVDPQDSALSTYYELTVDEAMDDFIMSHLAVTSRGLWVLPSGINTGSVTPASGEAMADARARLGSNYKMLLANDGTYIYDGSGVLVRSDTASGTDFAEERSFHFGSDDAYILYTPASGSAPASLVIGGANVQLGSSKTLSQWEADMQQAVDDAASALDSATLVITSTAGNLFKNGTESTVLQVAVFPNGGGRLDTIADVRSRFGAGAYIEWRWRHDAEGTWGTLATSDPHLSNGGMWLTVTPVDVESKTSFEASLVVP